MANFFPDTLLLVTTYVYGVSQILFFILFFVKIFAIMPSIPRQHSLVVWEMASQWEWTGHLHAYTDNFAQFLQTRERLQSIWKKNRIILEHPVHTATAFPSESQSINPATFYYQLFLPLPPGGLFSHACTHKIYVQCTASSNSWLYWSSYIYPYLRAFITNEKNH